MITTKAIEGITGILLIFLSIYILYFMDIIAMFADRVALGKLKFRHGDEYIFFLMLLGLGLFIGGFYLLKISVGMEVIKIKFLGLIMFAIGTFFIFQFPDSLSYQPGYFTSLALLIGFVFYAIAFYLLFFK